MRKTTEEKDGEKRRGNADVTDENQDKDKEIMECPGRSQPDNGSQSKTQGDVMRFAFGVKDFYQFNDGIQQEQLCFPLASRKWQKHQITLSDRSYSSSKPAFLQE